MTAAAPGVLRRRAGEPRPAKYRRKRELQDEFHIEAAAAEMRLADERKAIAIRVRAR